MINKCKFCKNKDTSIFLDHSICYYNKKELVEKQIQLAEDKLFKLKTKLAEIYCQKIVYEFQNNISDNINDG
jgi:hypothetical protein